MKGSAAVLIHSVREHYVGEMSVFSLVIVTQLDAFSVWATLSNSLLMCAAPGCLSRNPALETVTGVTPHFMTV